MNQVRCRCYTSRESMTFVHLHRPWQCRTVSDDGYQRSALAMWLRWTRVVSKTMFVWRCCTHSMMQRGYAPSASLEEGKGWWTSTPNRHVASEIGVSSDSQKADALQFFPISQRTTQLVTQLQLCYMLPVRHGTRPLVTAWRTMHTSCFASFSFLRAAETPLGILFTALRFPHSFSTLL